MSEVYLQFSAPKEVSMSKLTEERINEAQEEVRLMQAHLLQSDVSELLLSQVRGVPLNTVLQAVAELSTHSCMSEAVKNMSDALNDVLSHQIVSNSNICCVFWK